MKETDWNDCLINQSAKTITPDINRAKSLTETANDILKELNSKKYDELPETYPRDVFR